MKRISSIELYERFIVILKFCSGCLKEEFCEVSVERNTLMLLGRIATFPLEIVSDMFAIV